MDYIFISTLLFAIIIMLVEIQIYFLGRALNKFIDGVSDDISFLYVMNKVFLKYLPEEAEKDAMVASSAIVYGKDLLDNSPMFSKKEVE